VHREGKCREGLFPCRERVSAKKGGKCKERESAERGQV
jgi:hypothetical protein